MKILPRALLKIFLRNAKKEVREYIDNAKKLIEEGQHATK